MPKRTDQNPLPAAGFIRALSIASVVMAALGWSAGLTVVAGYLLSPIALPGWLVVAWAISMIGCCTGLFLGVFVRLQIRASGGTPSGQRLTLIGSVLGGVGLVVLIGLTLMAVLGPAVSSDPVNLIYNI